MKFTATYNPTNNECPTLNDFIAKYIINQGYKVLKIEESYRNSNTLLYYITHHREYKCIEEQNDTSSFINLYDLTWYGQVIVNKKQIGFIKAMQHILKKDELYSGFEKGWKIVFNSQQPK